MGTRFTTYLVIRLPPRHPQSPFDISIIINIIVVVVVDTFLLEMNVVYLIRFPTFPRNSKCNNNIFYSTNRSRAPFRSVIRLLFRGTPARLHYYIRSGFRSRRYVINIFHTVSRQLPTRGSGGGGGGLPMGKRAYCIGRSTGKG